MLQIQKIWIFKALEKRWIIWLLNILKIEKMLETILNQ